MLLHQSKTEMDEVSFVVCLNCEKGVGLWW